MKRKVALCIAMSIFLSALGCHPMFLNPNDNSEENISLLSPISRDKLSSSAGNSNLPSLTENITPPSLTNEVENLGDYNDVVIDRVDNSVYNEDSRLIGDFYYEKPYVPENFEAAKKINDYFNRDCNNFFNGTAMFQGEDAFQRVKEFLYRTLELDGDKWLVKQPYCYYVVTEMSFLSEDYISFRQTYIRAVGGPADAWNSGVTFSMKTGESVPFTEFFDVDANVFKANLCYFLSSWFGGLREDVIDTYSPNDGNTFEVMYYSTSVSLDKNYFYDGHSINLTLNYGFFPHNGLIVQWNGETGDMFVGDIYWYHLDGEGKLRL